jgi:hypothetical protein
MPISPSNESPAGGDSLQEALLLVLKDFTVPVTNTFDVGDLPVEPAPPEKVDAPDELPAEPKGTRSPTPKPGPNPPSPKPDWQPSLFWPWFLLAAALWCTFAGYVWHRFHPRRRSRLLDVPLFRGTCPENLSDGGEIRPSSVSLTFEELDHGRR